MASGYLTIDHVPPRASGGRLEVLTCKVCNNFAGTAYEADQNEARKAENFLRTFGAGGETERRSVSLVSECGKLNATLHKSAEGVIHLAPSSGHNPHGPDQIVEWIDESCMAGKQISIDIPLNYRKARVKQAELKTVFLLFFAKFGYTFVAHPYFDHIRSVLRMKASEETEVPIAYLNASDEQVPDILGYLDKCWALAPVNGRTCMMPLSKDAWRKAENVGAVEFDETFSSYSMPRRIEALMDHHAKSPMLSYRRIDSRPTSP
ncbi:MAG: hypothetical protein Gyms2KO_29190 [Gymnodinialimonas sp.]